MDVGIAPVMKFCRRQNFEVIFRHGSRKMTHPQLALAPHWQTLQFTQWLQKHTIVSLSVIFT
jgi:hypothetical protein